MNNFFVFEGPDEVGKTTVISALEKRLIETGKNCISFSFPGRENSTLGGHIYELHHNLSLFKINEITPLSLQILHVAAHADIVERKILSLLEEQKTVILLDRYWWSTWVYGVTSGIPKKQLKALIDLEKTFWNNIYPTQLFLFSRPASDSPSNLTQAYNELALLEHENHPIINLINNGTVDDAVNSILTHMKL